MEKTLIIIRLSMLHKVIITIVGLILVFSTASIVNGQQKVTSNCVETKVGDPKSNSAAPANCNKNTTPIPSNGKQPEIPAPKGKYVPPVAVDSVAGIATEMAAYAGGFTFEGHEEHAGLDIGAVANTPIYAVADGKVTYIHPNCVSVATSVSCRIEITHDGDDFISSYTHVDMDPSLAVGNTVKAGSVIAGVHAWNNDHLHFELQSQKEKDPSGLGININPRNYIPEYNQFPISPGYNGDVRAYTNAQEVFWADDGRDFANTFRDHPPCTSLAAPACWAH